ncbi:MAG: UDP-N-acetylmuramoylalanine--D-glutamate ligase [Candidatus Marinimicrobia bacterium]|nr:UDP-N-acetylmuramoylalanine--D-glutamate ligase [Candidatus Neomarinimicrobiota bacterium]
MRQQDKIQSLESSRVIVLGAQRSGLAAAQLLNHWGASVLISDIATDVLSEDVLRKLESIGIEYELGGHSEKVFNADLVIVSPGIPNSASVIKDLEVRQIPMISEVELASWFVDSPVIGITGSNGKTTTSTLVSQFLDIKDTDPALVGNIGNPFANELLDYDENDSKKKFS